VVRPASDAQAMEITIVENLQREDLNPIEQARAYERLARDFNMTQEQMAQRTGKDRASVANFLRLLRLPPEAMIAIEDGRLSFGHGKVLMMLTNEPLEIQVSIVEKVLDKDLSVRQTEELIRTVIGPQIPRPAKSEKPKDPNVKAAEEALQRTLGCKVTIDDHDGKGKIVLQYASLEDFDRIVEVLGNDRQTIV
jgi:ParB family chromosome partitioning protein